MGKEVYIKFRLDGALGRYCGQCRFMEGAPRWSDDFCLVGCSLFNVKLNHGYNAHETLRCKECKEAQKNARRKYKKRRKKV